MRRSVILFFLFAAIHVADAESRFGRTVIKAEPGKTKKVRVDDVNYTAIDDGSYPTRCLVYRGKEWYYVELVVTNKTASPLAIPITSIVFEKSGYTVDRIDTMIAARRAAQAAGMQFVQTAPPYVTPTYTTTVNATATTYGNRTNVSGTATTTPDYSGQAGANLGNAIGNAIAARRFYKVQQQDVAFSRFLAAHAPTNSDLPLQPGQTRTIVATFEQAKLKKHNFKIQIVLGSETFDLTYKE